MSHTKVLGNTLLLSILLGGLSGCNQPTTFAPTNTDQFNADSGISLMQASQVMQADYLFVIDPSFSMSTSGALDSIESAMSSFATYLGSSGIDFKVGLANGGTHSMNSGSYVGQPSVSATANNFLGSVLTPQSGTQIFNQVQTQVSGFGDPLQPDRTVPLAAARRVLTAQGSSFLRAGSQMVLVFVSDSDDESNTGNYSARVGFPTAVADYVTYFKSLKSDPSYISARAYVSCTPQSYNAYGARIVQTAQQVDSLGVVPQCLASASSASLQNLARNVTRPTSRFALQSRPLSGTIVVTINGVVTPAAGNWSYASATNEIIFVSGHEPGASAQLQISYDSAYVLSHSPKVDTIAVTVDGVSVAQDASNGWSYVASENRIAFNGSAKPSTNADIKVTYQVQ